jgi:hypothetical protein
LCSELIKVDPGTFVLVKDDPVGTVQLRPTQYAPVGVRHHGSPESPLCQPIDDFVGAGILPALLTDQAVALLTEAIDLGLHPNERWRCQRAEDLESLCGDARSAAPPV